MAFLKQIPALLVGLRFGLGLVLFGDALDGQTGGWFVFWFIVAFLSDIFDGVIARRLDVSTARLRLADGWVDAWFYVWVGLSFWIVYPTLLSAHAIPLLTLIGLQLLSYIFDWFKFGRLTSYHAYIAKLWGISLFIAIIAIFGFGEAGLFLWATLILGIISSLENIIMSLILPTWQHDIPTLYHAWQYRQGYVNDT